MGAELKKIWVTMITGWSDPAPTIDFARKAQQVVADQEWEDEGGSIKPAKKPAGAKSATKIPF
jgi:hypothetical protein